MALANSQPLLNGKQWTDNGERPKVLQVGLEMRYATNICSF